MRHTRTDTRRPERIDELETSDTLSRPQREAEPSGAHTLLGKTQGAHAEPTQNPVIVEKHAAEPSGAHTLLGKKQGPTRSPPKTL